MKIITMDAGTTAVKGVLMEENGTVIAEQSLPVTTRRDGEKQEQDPEEWYENFCAITRCFHSLSDLSDLGGVVMSGHFQDAIFLGEDGSVIRNCILYSDGRAGREAEEIIAELSADDLVGVTGNHYDGLLPLPRILWVKNHEPEIYQKTGKVLISSKDYLNYRLTGVAAGDYTTLSAAGAMDIRSKKWDEKILRAGGAQLSWMPKPMASHDLVGTVTAEASRETALPEGTRIFCGIADAGATTLASGIASPGEYNINLGTTGWVATVSSDVHSEIAGCFNLAAYTEDRYINVVPFLNGAGVHGWITKLFSEGEGEPDYEGAEKAASQSPVGSDHVRCLPYLNGERFPIMDENVRGTFAGISPQTTKGDLIRSTLEGVAFSIRQGIETIGAEKKQISMIGGGAKVSLWCQIMADVLGHPVYVYRNAEYLPALALAASVLLHDGKIGSYGEFTEKLQGEEYAVRYTPVEENVKAYDEIYREYLRLYPAIKSYY